MMQGVQSVSVPGQPETIATARPEPLPWWKRFLDIAVITLLARVLAPLAVVLSLWVKLSSRGPVLFRQERIGQGGRLFTIYKFRSMQTGASSRRHEEHVADLCGSDRPMTKLDALGDSRLIPGAGFLRKTGLDELPQLVNVLRGEMSIVGPRPCLPGELSYYRPRDLERFRAAPGLTGFWQVNGKNKTTFNEMVAMDIHYARNTSLWLDLLIIARTPFALLEQVLTRNI